MRRTCRERTEAVFCGNAAAACFGPCAVRCPALRVPGGINLQPLSSLKEHPMSIRRLRLFGAALALLLSLAACGPGNTVRLVYAPVGEPLLPQPDAPRVTVVKFDDKRSQQAVGVLRNGASIAPGSTVADWAARSLGDELTRLGPQVSYSPTRAAAKAAGAPFTVTGVVHEVWLKEVNPAVMTAAVRLTVTLTGKDGTIYAENLSSTQERTGMASSSAAESLLADTLRDVLLPAAQKIASHLR